MEYKRLTKKYDNEYIVDPLIYIDRKSILGKVVSRLAELVDKIENGTLIELPCKVGDKIYYIIDYGSVAGECVSLESGKVKTVSIQEKHIWIEANYEDGLHMHHREDEIGKWVFLTREEAEKRLEELKK